MTLSTLSTRSVRVLLAAGLAVALGGCQFPGIVGQSAVPQFLALRAAVTLRTGLRLQATAAEIHHLRFQVVSESDAATVVASVEAAPPYGSPVTVNVPTPPEGSYRLTVEAFGGTAADSGLTVNGPLLSSNSVVISGGTPAYSTGTAFAFPADLFLKTGGTVAATVSAAGASQVDVELLAGGAVISTLALAPLSFPVRHLPPGTYRLRATGRDAGGTVTGTGESADVTVAGAETGYAVSGAFEITL